MAGRVGVLGFFFGGLLLGSCLPLPEPPGVDCGDHPACGVGGLSCSTGHCIAIEGCASAICIGTEQACRETCGTPSCAILESYPEQIACEHRDPVPGNPSAGSCQELEGARDAELAEIQSCANDEECGQVLFDTSCGCTRNLVARLDADTLHFEQIQAALNLADCDGLVSTCDCPPADGFECVNGRCSWNYLE